MDDGWRCAVKTGLETKTWGELRTMKRMASAMQYAAAPHSASWLSAATTLLALVTLELERRYAMMAMARELVDRGTPRRD